MYSDYITIDFIRFMKLYTNCSIFQNLCFEFLHNLCKSRWIWQNQSLFNRWKNMLICQRTTPVQYLYEVYQFNYFLKILQSAIVNCKNPFWNPTHKVFLLPKSSLITACLSIISFVFAIYSEITGFIELWGLIALSWDMDRCKKWYFVSKNFLTFCEKKCSFWWLEFKAEGRKFTK